MRPDPNAACQLTSPLATLWRGAGTLQLGLEPPAGLLISDAVPAMVDVVNALTTPLRRDQLERVAGHDSAGWLDRLLSILRVAGLLRPVPVHAQPVCVIGTGRLATLLTELLLDQLPGEVRLIWPGAAGPSRDVVALKRRFGDRLLFAGHWSFRSTTEGITLVAARAPEPERSLVHQLTLDGQAHLIVRASDLGAAVGPLVIPGRTPCQRCDDLHSAARDPAWPHLLAQLCRDRPDAPSLVLHWAATTAALHAIARLNGALPDSVGATLELTAERQFRLRRLRPHPGCGCLDFG